MDQDLATSRERRVLHLRQIIRSRDSSHSYTLSPSRLSRSIGSRLTPWPDAFERLKQMKTKTRLKRSSSSLQIDLSETIPAKTRAERYVLSTLRSWLRQH
ncbi:hypothetical protein ACJ72_00787 [Emergomyces africanus]|uniref:Uncharacterized protein n=1 Tax=Emergomyces africanus TaxID=1955775 RepID=A0A1B7P7F6_9EURO|nr:hypothetical protein ACJ72_00787 [Emergomyces africanus]